MAFVRETVEPFGLDRGAFGERHLFGFDLARQFDGKVLALRRPFGSDEKLSASGPTSPARA
jgi:hypothetical protein